MDRLIVGNALSRSNLPAGGSPRIIIGGSPRSPKGLLGHEAPLGHLLMDRGLAAVRFDPHPPKTPEGVLGGTWFCDLSANPSRGDSVAPVAAISAKSTG